MDLGIAALMFFLASLVLLAFIFIYAEIENREDDDDEKSY